MEKKKINMDNNKQSLVQKSESNGSVLANETGILACRNISSEAVPRGEQKPILSMKRAKPTTYQANKSTKM